MHIFECNKCHEVKPTTDFIKESRSERGHTTICKTCTSAYMREYKKSYRQTEKYKQSRRAYQTSDVYRAWQREQKRKPSERERERAYRKNRPVPEDVRIKRNEYRLNRYRSNPKVRVDQSMANTINKALRGKKAGRRWETLTGYNIAQLMNHLESLFDENMTWENYGSYWHIDHKLPKSMFKYDDANCEEFKYCWSLENLQPLEAFANLSKSNKIIYEVQGVTL